MVKAAEYIINFLADKGIEDIFFISGGGNRFLADAIGKSPKLRYICNHHEQAVSMAVEAYTRVKGVGAGIVTTGPGVTNALTGVYGAWTDSTPCVFLSGQVEQKYVKGNSELRQLGVQEVDAIATVKPFTKYAEMIKDPDNILYHLEKAFYIAHSGRPGPVWLDVPLDIQRAEINPKNLRSYQKEETRTRIDENLEDKVSKTIEYLEKSERPVLYVGQGIRLSKALNEYEELISRIRIPILVSWNAADLIEDNHPLYIGRFGMFGQRAANFAVQNSDLFLSIGSRLSISQTGYNFKAFAREARKIVVDIDPIELNNKPIKPDIPICSDAKEFLKELNKQLKGNMKWERWLDKCYDWKNKFPNVPQAYRNQEEFVNSYVFIEELSDLMNEGEVITTDMGTSFTGTYQAIKIKKGQRIITSMGAASMGWGLPGSIGACIANNRNRTICISGDGGLQMNIQELQTVKHYNLPIKLFVLNNEGYLTIKEMQDRGHNGLYVGSDPKSGVSCPDIVKVSEAYGLPADRVNNHKDLLVKIKKSLDYNGPFVLDIIMDPHQALEPRVISKTGKSGKKFPAPLEEMSPQLSKEELTENMIVNLYDE